jgi:hypothetical protein
MVSNPWCNRCVTLRRVRLLRTEPCCAPLRSCSRVMCTNPRRLRWHPLGKLPPCQVRAVQSLRALPGMRPVGLCACALSELHWQLGCPARRAFYEDQVCCLRVDARRFSGTSFIAFVGDPDGMRAGLRLRFRGIKRIVYERASGPPVTHYLFHVRTPTQGTGAARPCCPHPV